eukprot:TRINITY_DN4119_c0_g1_i6.p1 TRINITY_DN4119_c0_g1~~TRINITY_DN4119_c0_g1_i6.p1  ORF type:complete len:248 (+),score=-5.97 TRINITY_DN4119_c0_g1_i6:66-809(+)
MCIRDSMGRLQQCRSTLIQLSLFLLNENDYGGFSDVGLVSLSRFLSTLTCIRELSIYWCINRNTTDNGCCELTNAISRLNSLSHLQLHLPADYYPFCHVYERNSLTDTTIMSMCTMLGSLIRLSHLDLDLKRNHMITDSEVIAVSRKLSQLTHLISFQINLRRTGISDDGVSHVMNAIQSLKQLNLLHLDLSSCQDVTDDGVPNIMNVIRARTSLIDIKVSVKWTSITQVGYDKLMSIRALRNLRLL